MKQKMILRYAAGIALFAGGAWFKHFEYVYPAVLCFLALIIGEGTLIFYENRNILDLRLLLTISWLTGILLAALNLSSRQSPWSTSMWLSCGGFYFLFLAGYDLNAGLHRKRDTASAQEKKELSPVCLKRIKQAIYIVMLLGVSSVLTEAIKFKFAFPIFVTDKPHAYTEFHITGLHYFVVSLMFVHALSMIYLLKKKPGKKEKRELLLLNLIAFSVPVLLLSKFQIMICFAIPIVVFVLAQERFSARQLTTGIVVSAVIVIGIGIVMILGRHYPEGYLEEIFAFRDPSVPMSVQYPYMYIVNNLENLNLLTIRLEKYSFGIRQLYPAFALTGLKFVPAVQQFMWKPVYLTVEELTTLSVIYDAYGDFGLAGVFLFGLLTGAISAGITRMTQKHGGVLGVLLYAQFAVYMTLSFFTTWFSNPTTWFWLIASFCIALYCTIPEGKFRIDLKEITEEFK